MNNSQQIRFSGLDESDIVGRAARNAQIIRWYHAQNEETQINIRMFYAEKLGCPLCEITEDLLEPADLDFLWSLFEKQIRAFEA